jgi:8-oxo-dGTP pyrophosphatase MutT (NUDIX family)
MTLPAERWTSCELDHVHWGVNGGAGLLVRYAPENAEPIYLLAQRSRWVDEGGRWGIPGGAIRDGESPEMAARRETVEEIGTLPSYRVTGVQSQDCGGGWIFHTISADVEDRFDAFCGQETDATGWFTREEMRHLPLHPGIQRWLDR